jgi:hypothetical protein
MEADDREVERGVHEEKRRRKDGTERFAVASSTLKAAVAAIMYMMRATRTSKS